MNRRRQRGIQVILDCVLYRTVYQQYPARHQRSKRMANRDGQAPPIPLDRLLPPIHGGTQDPENEMWNMYLNEVKEEDKRITDAWKEDANGILVFVSPSLLIPYYP